MHYPDAGASVGPFSLCRKSKRHQKQNLILLSHNECCRLHLSLSASRKPRDLFQVCIHALKRGASQQLALLDCCSSAQKTTTAADLICELQMTFFPPFFFFMSTTGLTRMLNAGTKLPQHKIYDYFHNIGLVRDF